MGDTGLLAPSVACSGRALVNDLDLVAGPSLAQAHAGNFQERRDERNNKEHVVTRWPVNSGAMHVKVRARQVIHGPQPFALAVSGGFAPNRVTSSAAPDGNCSMFHVPWDHFPPAAHADYFPLGVRTTLPTHAPHALLCGGH